jgi:hypothetical protein
MKSTLSRIGLRIGKITGISAGSILLLLFLLPYLFPGFVSGKIRQWARKSIKTELSFSTARLSFFRHFPALTLTLYDVKLKGSAPFERETLIDAHEISLGVDLRSIFSEVDIDKIFLTDAFINIQVDTAGHPNYNIYNAKKSSAPSEPADSGSASLKIQQILIEKSKLVYNDRSLPMLIDARGFNYQGSGDLSKDISEVRKIQYNGLDIDSFRGSVSIDSGRVRLDTTTFTLVGAPVEMNASLKGGGTLSLSKVKVKGMRLFGAVSKETNKDVNDPDLSRVEIKSTINNNLITIERTRMKASAFKLRIEGQTSFDGKLNLHIRVGLPPFGVIGIPVTVIGTEDKPIVKVRRGSKKDELGETEDKDEANQ